MALTIVFLKQPSFDKAADQLDEKGRTDCENLARMLDYTYNAVYSGIQNYAIEAAQIVGWCQSKAYQPFNSDTGFSGLSESGRHHLRALHSELSSVGDSGVVLIVGNRTPLSELLRAYAGGDLQARARSSEDGHKADAGTAWVYEGDLNPDVNGWQEFRLVKRITPASSLVCGGSDLVDPSPGSTPAP